VSDSEQPEWFGAWGRLWNPHRMAYIQGESKPRHEGEGEDCPFCVSPAAPMESSLVFGRGELVYGVMNLYPYNVGHVMVCPYRHVSDYTDLTAPEVGELGLFTQRAMTTLREVSGAQGFNLGMNQGSVAGAGIAGHLHQHIVPRWGGDTNFLPIISGTRSMSQLLVDTCALLREAWPHSASTT
jgi:ATP adenylyltransferase